MSRSIAEEVLAGGGEMGAFMRSMDWSKTALGPVDQWPQSLRTTVSTCLNSRFPIVVWWGPDMVMLYNDAYRPIAGNKHPGAMGQRGRECWPEIWHIIGPMLDGVLARGDATWSENQFLPLERHGFAEECYFTFSYSPIRDESGGVGGIFTAVAETTRQVLDARRLKTLQEFSARSPGTPTVAETCSMAMGVLAANAADIPFAALYLVNTEGTEAVFEARSGLQQTGAAFPQRVSLAPVNDARWPFAVVASTGNPVRVDGLLERVGPLPLDEGRPVPTSALVLAVARPGEAKPAGFLVIGISPRLLLDAKYQGFLELVAGSLATSISSARAYEEERKRAAALAEIDRAKTDFFANVSHEFRTPLTLMLGPIEDGLADTEHPLSPEQRERQELVRRNGLRLQKLVNTLLDFARIEAGRAHASFVPSDLSAFTRDLASSFDSAMTSAGLKWVVDCPPLPEPVYVDPTMWEKVVLNLISNALKFTFKGEVRVALKWLGERVELTVQDTGTGIPEKELPRIFDRFHRVEGARGRSHEGTGIGLALVQELVSLHGGKVEVKSALGKGSVFTVSMPTGSAHLPKEHLAAARTLTSTGIGPSSFLAEVSQWNEAEAPSSAAHLRTPAQPDASTLAARARILVADDNADMRTYLSRLLSPHWMVEVVSDGAQALAAAQQNPPDLILSDVMMPGMNGLELAQALRADARTRAIPVVLLSARAGEEAAIEGLKSGAYDYLVKPFSANELLARVNGQLTVSNLRQEALRTERAHAVETTRRLEEARLATRAREETLAVVSHDLRSPLTTINTAVALIERVLDDGPHPVRLRKQTNAIRSSVGRMNRLIGDLLDLASIDAGTFSLDLSPHAAEELAREVQEIFEPQALQKGIELAMDVEPGLPLRELDKERILQCLSNLVANALKFTPEGGSIRVRAQQASDGVLISVSDTGIGISPQALPHVFDRYWHSAQKGREGHGLGLSIAWGIVEAHGGTLRAESEVGKGSTFSILLPSHSTPRSRIVAQPEASVLETVFPEGGEMGALLRSTDWAKTPLGPVEAWPQSLRTTVSVMLASPHPSLLYWGPELVVLYNDHAKFMLGTKHPGALGLRYKVVFQEAWSLVAPLLEGAMETGVAVDQQNLPIPLYRFGFLEDCFFTFALVPANDESGKAGGILSLVTDTTAQVIGARRLTLIRELSLRAALAQTVEGVFRSNEEVLNRFTDDVPFSLLYELREDGAHCIARSGLAASPSDDDGNSGHGWPLEEVSQSGEERLVEQPSRFGPARALLLPLADAAKAGTRLVLVVGLNPRIALNEDARSFLQLLGRQLGASIASTRALEEKTEIAAQLAELDRQKTHFFSNISHEFRTPLTLILGPVEDALAQVPKSLSGEKLDLVRRNALRLYKMVNTLLDFSRVEAGRAQASYVPTDLSAFTANLASAFHSAAESAGLALVVDCPPMPEAVYVDPEMWEKVVLNLLSNAVKYTYEGEIRVSLQWEDEHAVLRVRDTGVGIPPDEVPRVFERFYRVRLTQGRSQEGSGIGLALVQELVKLHGGSVAVISKLGEGTTFTVRLPRGSAHLPTERVERTSRPRSSATGAAPFVEEARHWSAPSTNAVGANSLGSQTVQTEAASPSNGISQSRILLVDDNADLRTYVAGLLGQVFPHVETASNGNEGLACARAHRPDLVLSDVMMPGLDGFGLVRELRKDERTRGVPIILLSARAGDEPTVEGLESGADDYLVKPFAARELIARVRTQLEMARVRREVAQLELSEQQLRAKVEARDEWLTVVSHELRTPLSALVLSVQSLIRSVASKGRKELAPESVDTKARTAERHLSRLTRQVEQLVDFAELVSGRLELAFEEVDLSALVATVVETTREKARRVGCDITLSAGAPVVGRYDRARLSQMMESLLDNALKFGGGKPVEVAVTREEGAAWIRIADHGAGVGLEDRERVFARFERAASTRNYGGFGLGLWMARHIAEAHAGSIHLTQGSGGGALLSVTLPLAPSSP